MPARTVFAASLFLASVASAAIVPFTETFGQGPADWRFSTAIGLTAQPAGGPDGSAYVSTPFSFASQTAGAFPVLFRGQENFGPAGSSGGAFAGNWITDGVTELSAFVRHDASVPLTFFARIARSPAPGAISSGLFEVPANTWTRVTFAITPNSPQWFNFEGSDFATVLSAVARVQLGVFVPASLAGSTTPLTFDLDSVSIVPAPAGLGAFALLLRRRRR